MHCDHCGQCCRAQICESGMRLWPYLEEYEDDCPAIVEVDNKVFCGLVTDPQRYKDIPAENTERVIDSIKEENFIGLGCTNPYNKKFHYVEF